MSFSAFSIVRGFLLAAVLLIVGGGLTYLNAVRMQELSRIVDQSQEALTSSETIRRELFEAEFSTRGLVLTGNAEFLDRYAASVESIETAIARLRSVSINGPDQLVRIDRVESIIAEDLARLSNILDLAQTDPDAAIGAVVAMVGASGTAGNPIDDAIDDFQGAERQSLLDRRADEETRARATRGMLLAGVAASVLFLGIAAFLVVREFRVRRKTEDELRESEALYRDLFENASDLIQSVDRFGRFRYVNGAWRRTLGYSSEEAAAMTFEDVVHPDSLDHCRAAFAKLQAGEAIDRIEVAFRSKSGKAIEVEGSISTRYDGSNLVSSRGIFRDLTQRRKAARALREAEERYREIFEKSVEGVFQLTPGGRMLAANQATARILGYDSPEELMAAVNEHGARLHQDPRALIRLLRELQKHGEVHEYEHRLVRKDGATVWIAGSGRATFDDEGNIAYFEGNIADISVRKKAEEALRVSEQRFRTLAGNAPVGIFLSDNVGRCILVNDRYTKITGLDSESALGKGWLEGVHPEDDEDVARVWTEASSRQREFQLEYRMIRPNGETCWVSGRASALTDESGLVSGYVGTLSDITARKRAEVERDQFFNMSLDLLCIVDFSGVMRRLNPAWVEALGFPMHEMIGAHYLTFVHPDDCVSVAEMVLGLQAGNEIVQFEARFRTSARGYRWLSWSAVGDVGQRRIYATARDVTEQRRMSDELQEMNVALRQQNVRVEKANRMKSEFLANMSHELRTPLNGIIGFAELMRDGRAGPVSEIHAEFLDDILSSSRHLLQLINDILDLSKVEAGKMDFRPEKVRLDTIVREVSDIVRELAAEKGIQMVSEIDPSIGEVDLDPAKLKQVLYNFVSNALKFTETGGTVTARAFPIDSRLFRLEVEDTGIGIRSEDMDRLFEEFRQLDEGSSKKYQGTGLGLALTRRLVEAQGGVVGVDSVFGRGSTFHAVLPREFRTGAAREVEVSHVGESAPAILVVEDEPADAEVIVRTLENGGYHVVLAANGAQAARQIAARRFDAITLDLLLPDTAGWDVLRRIRSSDLNVDTPVIVLTVVTDTRTPYGFTVHCSIPKPVDRTELLAALKSADVRPELNKRVLVVDDDTSILKLMTASLRDLGYLPVCVGTAEGGIAAAREHSPDVVIMDYTLPGMSGIEFLTRFREDPAHRRTPVILWTSDDLEAAEIRKLKRLGTHVVFKRNGGMRGLLEELHGQIPVSASATPNDREPAG